MKPVIRAPYFKVGTKNYIYGDTLLEYAIAAKSGIKDGIVVVNSHHTTCSVITQECAFDMSMTGLETLQQDLVNCFEEVVMRASICTPARRRWPSLRSTEKTTLAVTIPMPTCALPSLAEM